MDKKQLIGFVLIFIILIAINFINKPSEEELAQQKKMQDSIALVQQQKNDIKSTDSSINFQNTDSISPDSNMVSDKDKLTYASFASYAMGKEKEFTLENENLLITFTNKGGKIKDVILKKYNSWLEDENHEKIVKPVELLNNPNDNFEFTLPVSDALNGNIKTGNIYFETDVSSDKITFKIQDAKGVFFKQTYTLNPDSYELEYSIEQFGLNLNNDNNIKLNWDVYLMPLEKAQQYENTYSTLFYKTESKVKHLSYTSKDDEKVDKNKILWVSNVNQFFNTTLMTSDNPFQSADFEVISHDKDEKVDYLKICKSNLEFPPTDNFKMKFLLAPNEFNLLKSYGSDLDMVIAYGWNIFGSINRWIIRPFFLFLNNIVGSMGIAIIILIFIIKGLLYPLNYKMLMSSTKMQVLKPEIDKIKEKTKDDTQQQQIKTMELYRKYGVSPFGGCLPMVLQMPIWFALFRFFPATIEFRHVPFLWADDLSSYESIAYLPFNIPMYGSHVSLFALLWGISSVIYAHYNMKTMDMGAGSSQTQAMKYMQYIMPVFFIVFFNSYASGLNVYMFFSNLFTILQTIITKRFIIDEDKVRAKLELKKDKPKKKSSFSQRLEEAMKQQQALADQKKKGK
ncbi:MAG: membrane protein insertase YidC [Saprospiraceae bacterium]